MKIKEDNFLKRFKSRFLYDQRRSRFALFNN